MTDRFRVVADRLSELNDVGQLDTPEADALFDEFMRLAPPELKDVMWQKFREFNPDLPPPAKRGKDGERLWTDVQLAEYLGEPIEDVRARIESMVEHGATGVRSGEDAEWLN